jgi:HTH-type transcriptional regulator/antitoxin HipB
MTSHFENARFEAQILGTIGHLIREMRKQRGFSQRDLSSQIGVNRTTLSRIENGKQNLNFVLFAKIAAAMECFIDVEMIPAEIDN